MKKIIRTLVTIGLSAIVLAGCRQVNIYSFEGIQLDFGDGKLSLIVNGTYGEEYSENGDDQLDWAAPYRIQFTYRIPKNIGLNSIEVRDIVLTGAEDGSTLSIPNLVSDTVWDSDETETKFTRISSKSILSPEFKYQNYQLTATVVILGGVEMLTEKISVLLKTNFRVEKRNDKFDEIMSI